MLHGSAARRAAMPRQNISGTQHQQKWQLLCALCCVHTMDKRHRIPPLPGPNTTPTNPQLHPNSHTHTHLSDRRVLVHRHGDLARRGVLSKIPRGNVSVSTLVWSCVIENASHSVGERRSLLRLEPTISFFSIFIGFPHQSPCIP